MSQPVGRRGIADSWPKSERCSYCGNLFGEHPIQSGEQICHGQRTPSADVKPYTREELGLFPDGPALNVEGMVGLSVEKYNRLLNTARAGPEDQDVEPTNETLDDIMSEPEVFRAWSHYDNVPIPERGDARMLVAAILRADRRRTRSGRASPNEGKA